MPYWLPISNFYPHDFGVSQSKTRTLPIPHMRGGDPSLIRCSSKTAEQNFMELSGLFTTWCHTAPSIWNVYPHDFGVSQSKTRTLPLRHMWAGGSLIHYFSKTSEQNIMTLSGIVHYMMPYCTSYLSFYSNDFGFPQSKTRTLPYKTWGSGGIILWALLTVFLVLILTYVKQYWPLPSFIICKGVFSS